MRNDVTVTALRTVEVGGKTYQKGDVFHVTGLAALTLAKRGHVSLTRRARVSTAPAIPEPSPAVGSLELESEAPEALIRARRGRPPKPRE